MNTYFSCLLIGPPGAGKTTAASTAPKPILYLDMDNKMHKMVNLREKLSSKDIVQWTIDVPLAEISLTRLATIDPKPGAKVTFKRPKGYLELAGKIDKLVDFFSGC